MSFFTWIDEKLMLRKLIDVSESNSWNVPLPAEAIACRSASAAGRSSANGTASGLLRAARGKRRFVSSSMEPT